MAALVSVGSVCNKPTGATLMLAPQPFEPDRVALCQGIPAARFSQALKQVIPGARLFSGETNHSTKYFLSACSNEASVNGVPASTSASPTARAICVSSVTRIGLPGGSFGPSGGQLFRIWMTSRNSVGAPRASPKARPINDPKIRSERELIPANADWDFVAEQLYQPIAEVLLSARDCHRPEVAKPHHCATILRHSFLRSALRLTAFRVCRRLPVDRLLMRREGEMRDDLSSLRML